MTKKRLPFQTASFLFTILTIPNGGVKILSLRKGIKNNDANYGFKHK